MTEALMSSVLEQLHFVLNQDLTPLTRGVARQLQYLTEALMNIRTLIQDAEEKQSRDEPLNNWLQMIKEEAYDMDDFFDEWRTDILRSSTRQQQKEERNSRLAGIKEMTCCGCLISTTIALRDRRVQRIKAITERLDIITKESYKFHLSRAAPNINQRQAEPRASAAPNINQRQAEPRVSLPLVDESIVYGLESDKENIKHKLLMDSLEHEIDTGGLYVLCIVGMGGLGKTTLPKLIYNDDQVKSHFELRIWVHVSQIFDQVRIAREIIRATTSKSVNNDGSSFEHLLHRLSNCVKEKRFLLVLDDVWNEDIEKWEQLNRCLERGARGSSILVTTRNESVAYMMSTTPLHRPLLLNEENSWHMLSGIALKGRDEQEIKMLKDIGKAIGKRCGGIPLAVKTVAGHLRYKNQQEWLSVLERFEQPLGMGSILPAVELSYYNLASSLRQCFAYCAIFPKDYRIEKDMLIKLWMAQGFLGSSTGSTDLERIGEEYFSELVMPSFFQDLEEEDGKVTHCRMHDLLHDFAMYISNGSIVMGVYNTELIGAKIRHLSVSNLDLESVLLSVCEAKNLSTLKLFDCRWGSPIISPNLFYHLRCLRALDLSFLGIEDIPSEVGRLMHLRYLDLSGTNLECLPESVCDLYNLQTLKLNECGELCELPKDMKKLINLRHLEIQNTPKLCYLPQGISRLSSLRTLSKFTMSVIEGECKIGELSNLHELRGKIDIGGLCKVKSLAEASEAGLMNKGYLHELIFNFLPYELENVEEGEIRRMEGVLEGLQPHQNLEKLAIHHCHISKFPSWMVGDSILSNLRILKIHDCKECIELPAFGKLPSLRELHLEKLDALKHIGKGFYALGGGDGGVKIVFPKLEELHVVDMPNLEHWDFTVQDEKVMPRLCDLSLQDCPKLMSLPVIFPNTLKNLRINGCPKLPSSTLEKLTSQGVKLVLPM